MEGLWQNREQAINPALDTSGDRLPTTFGDLAHAAWSRNTLFAQDYIGENDRMSALDDYLAKVKTMTGRDDIRPDQYTDPVTGDALSAQALLRQTNDKVNKLKHENPELELEPLTPEQLSENGNAKRRQADADFEATLDRPRQPYATVGRILGGLAAGTADPINLMALPIAPEAELGILASAMRWGAVTGGAALAGTALAAPYQAQVKPGYLATAEPYLDIAQAAGFGALGGAAAPLAGAIARPVISRLAAVWDRLRGPDWPTSVKDAGNIVSSEANVINSNIYPGAAGAVAHEQALAKTSNDILARRPVDVSEHITPELEAAHAANLAPIEPSRLDAKAATVAAERPIPTVPAPELPFERTALEAEAEARKQKLVLDVYDHARNHGYDDIPMEEAGRIADKLMDASPDEAQKILRDMQMSPRQVADAMPPLERAPERMPIPVTPVADIHAPDFQAAARADLERELATVPPHAEPRSLAEIDKGAAPTTLPEQHELYFKLDEHTRMVPIEDLISSKTPEENIKGAANGAKRMAASAAGEIGRRAPITVRPLPDGKYLVLDGNGTLTAATNYGWRAMPVKLEKSQISDMGMPSRAASLAETGRVWPGMKSESIIEPSGASVHPTPPLQISKRAEPLGSLINRAIDPLATTGPTRMFGEFNLGDIDAPSNKNILQGTNDVHALHERANLNKPLIDERLAHMAADIPGARYYGSRVKKLEGPSGLLVKVETQAKRGIPANNIPDYIGARFIADTREALSELAQRLHDTGAVLEDDNFLETGKNGYRARHMQMALGDGTSVEVQLHPTPTAKVSDAAHEIYDSVKRLKDSKDPADVAKFEKASAQGQKIFDDEWLKYPAWVSPSPERITGVAVRDRDTAKVYSAPNVMHVDMYDRAAKDLGMKYEEAYNARTAVGSRPRFDEGFTTNKGRYVGRQEAAAIAQRMGQAVEIRPKGLDAGDLLPIETPLPHGLATFSPFELGVDANKFQFKAGTDEAGVSERLKDVKTWDPIKAGTSIVWIDKAGKPWIVDGHQRLGLARRIAQEDPAQNPQLMAYTLREDEGYTPEKARAIAALTNISQGTGTAIDAAKVIRDHPEMAGDLPPRSELVRQARGLVNLSPDAFGMVVNDVVPANYAAIVGRLVPADADMQRAIIQLLAKTDPANAVQAEAITRQGIEAGMAKAEAGKQISLFGDQEVAQSLYLERAKVLDRALKTLRKDKAVFGTLVKEAETLEGAGNVLAKDINEQRAIADGQALQILQTLANRAGPISDALRAAAGKARTDGYASATREFVGAVRELHASGDLVRAADSLERGAGHVGSENTTELIDHGLAAEPRDAATIDAGEQDVKYAIAAARQKPGPSISAEVGAYEPGAEGRPQAIMPGMEPSARQLAAARAGPLRAGMPQEEPGELFGPAPEKMPDMFLDAMGHPQSFAKAMSDIDGMKIAADQLAACAAPEAA
jgi:hypothetical protein